MLWNLVSKITNLKQQITNKSQYQMTETFEAGIGNKKTKRLQ
jgi:hypothetical protein